MAFDPRYQELLQKIDLKASELQATHGAALNCRLGCHSCCQPHLTVFPVEAAHIRSYLYEQPERAAEALALEAADPFEGTRCSFLGGDGGCSIYPVRPVVCRTHGFPLEIREAERVFRDVCPLNFTAGGIEALPGRSVFNLQLINTLLSLINQHSHGDAADQRLPLRAKALLD